MPDDKSENARDLARNVAYRFLSYRPRSRSEIEQRLGDKGFAKDIVRSVLTDLVRLGYVNDHDFAGQWARSRVRLRGFGRRRIEQELKGKGVSREIIEETLAGLFADEAEIDIARAEAEKKLRTLSRFEPEVRRRRLAGFLDRKGFSADVVRSLIRDV